jgi:hypothetical protein
MADKETPSCILTVVRVLETEGAEPVKVLFSEAERIYKLDKAHPSFDHIVELLRDASAERRSVRVELQSIHSDVITDVRRT